MTIVKMKKLRVVAMADQREELLNSLQHLGCVEISEPERQADGPEWSALFQRSGSCLPEIRTKIADVDAAMAAIKTCSQVKEGMFRPRACVTEEEFLSESAAEQAWAICCAVNGQSQARQRLQGEETRLQARLAALQPWLPLDMPLEQSGTANTLFRLVVCPSGVELGDVRNELAANELAAELYEVSADKQQKYALLICHKAEDDAVQEILRPCGFSVTGFQNVTGSPMENADKLKQLLEENKQEQEAAVAAIAAEADSLNQLRLYADQLQALAAKAANEERLMSDGTVLLFAGWAPAESLNEVEKLLADSGCAWEASDPTDEDIPSVPVKLKNNWFTKPLNMVTNMYILPTYNSLDPNPLMAPFFVTFFGLMMADMGYGLLMILGAWFMMKKMHAKGGTKDFAGLLGLCGVSTLIWGALTGGFFGDFLTQLINIIKPGTDFTLPYLFTPLNDTLMILIGSLVLGVIQIFTGMAINVVKKFRDGQWKEAIWEEFTWWAVLFGAAVSILLKSNILLYIGLAMLLYSGTRGKKGFGKVTGIVGTVYNGVSGYFSDILSYARLMALMLAGSVIAQVFNTLGAVTGNVIGFVIISFIGNMLNFALNLLGCYVHDLRLQCLEFFNRFYEAGGKPFRPLAIQTKYVDVENK